MANGVHSPDQAEALPRNGVSIGWGERLREFSSLAVFLGELIANPRSVGAPIPSSRMLAAKMASFVPSDSSGLVVELGPGTGVITAALLARGIPPERLVLVERSYEMVKLLRRRFPGLRVIYGDAIHLGRILSEHLDLRAEPVGHIISSLPLRSLPQAVVNGISGEVRELLGRAGRLIQYTYDLRPGSLDRVQPFGRRASRHVWMNFPPARIDVFEAGSPR